MNSPSAPSNSPQTQLAIDLAALLLQKESSSLSRTPEQIAAHLLAEIESWAVGIWRVDEQNLTSLAFSPDPKFPAQVAIDFQQATQSVPLDQTQLGIVNAVVHRRPALAVATDQTGDLRKSAGWLQKFQAACSLSCPVNNLDGEPIGVLAVGWQELKDEQSPQAQKLFQITRLTAQELSRLAE